MSFGSRYILIYATTRDILLQPFEFGDRITDSPEETKLAAKYLGEGFLFFYSLLKLFDPINDSKVAGIPFADEVLALAIVASAIMAGLVAHPFEKLITSSSASIYGTLTCFLYWSGFSLFIIPPIFAGVIMGMDAFTAYLNAGENFQFFSFMLIGVPFMFVYYMGTICSWLAKVHDTEPVIAGIALIAAYIVPVGIVSLVGYAAQSLWALL
jgi:hypothetical protein